MVSLLPVVVWESLIVAIVMWLEIFQPSGYYIILNNGYEVVAIRPDEKKTQKVCLRVSTGPGTYMTKPKQETKQE